MNCGVPLVQSGNVQRCGLAKVRVLLCYIGADLFMPLFLGWLLAIEQRG